MNYGELHDKLLAEAKTLIQLEKEAKTTSVVCEIAGSISQIGSVLGKLEIESLRKDSKNA